MRKGSPGLLDERGLFGTCPLFPCLNQPVLNRLLGAVVSGGVNQLQGAVFGGRWLRTDIQVNLGIGGRALWA